MRLVSSEKNNNKRPFSRTTHSLTAAVSIKPLRGFPSYNPAVKFGARARVCFKQCIHIRVSRAAGEIVKKKNVLGTDENRKINSERCFLRISARVAERKRRDVFNGKSEVNVFGGEERKNTELLRPVCGNPSAARDKDV